MAGSAVRQSEDAGRLRRDWIKLTKEFVEQVRATENRSTHYGSHLVGHWSAMPTPSPSQINAFLLQMSKFCKDQAEDMGEALGEKHPGFLAARDRATILTWVRSADRETLWLRVTRSCYELALNVADHTRSIGVLLAEPQAGVPIYAHETATRVALESAAVLMHILDERESAEVRFARGVAHLIADADSAQRVAGQMQWNAAMRSPVIAATQYRDRLLKLIQRAKIDLSIGKRDVKGVRVTPDGPEAAVAVKVTELIRDRFPDMPAIYGQMSGVTHGMPWRLSNSATAIDSRSALWQPNAVMIGGSVLAATAAADRAMTVYAWYHGYDHDPVLGRLKNRFRAANRAVGSFAHQALGLDRTPLSMAWFRPARG